MNYTIRIARRAFESARSEVRRPHAFAYERVAFLWGRTSLLGPSECLVLLHDFTPIEDNHYMADDTVGARIGSVAIRAALGRVLETGESCFHFHVHPHHGRPQLSRTDAVELEHLIPTFVSGAPTAVHGALIASADSANAWVWRREAAGRAEACTVASVGFPTEIWRSP
jgi:hypothetical protein